MLFFQIIITASLPERLIQQNGTGARHIEGTHTRLHRYGGYRTALPQNSIGNTILFITKDDTAIAGKVDIMHGNALIAQVSSYYGEAVFISQSGECFVKAFAVVYGQFEYVSHRITYRTPEVRVG